MISYSHTHFNLDAKNQNYTVRFAGTKNLPGLGGGVPTLSAFDEEMKNSFKTGNFTLKRKVALLHLSRCFLGWLAYGGYGVQKNGKYAVKQGGRDHEAMHIHYFFDPMEKCTVVQYKYNEREDLPYIPAKPIKVCEASMLLTWSLPCRCLDRAHSTSSPACHDVMEITGLDRN